MPPTPAKTALSLAKEKHRLEGLARDYGLSRNQAKRFVHDYFKHDAEDGHE